MKGFPETTELPHKGSGSLVVQAPETKIQKNIIDELKALDDKINGQNAEIEKYENSIRTKFDQIFHLEEFISDGVFSKYEGYSVEDLCIDGRGRVIRSAVYRKS